MNGGDGDSSGSLNWKMRGRGEREGGIGVREEGGDIGDRKLTETKLFRNGGIRGRTTLVQIRRAPFLSLQLALSLFFAREWAEKLGALKDDISRICEQ